MQHLLSTQNKTLLENLLLARLQDPITGLIKDVYIKTIIHKHVSICLPETQHCIAEIAKLKLISCAFNTSDIYGLQTVQDHPNLTSTWHGSCKKL
jgi:hypothetical protein